MKKKIFSCTKMQVLSHLSVSCLLTFQLSAECCLHIYRLNSKDNKNLYILRFLDWDSGCNVLLGHKIDSFCNPFLLFSASLLIDDKVQLHSPIKAPDSTTTILVVIDFSSCHITAVELCLRFKSTLRNTSG